MKKHEKQSTKVELAFALWRQNPPVKQIMEGVIIRMFVNQYQLHEPSAGVLLQHTKALNVKAEIHTAMTLMP